ncbi:unnamed protein product [Phytophthora lilii]|uniref:Unnamed protein product n=1 Tax=Phytophthora lilii TaxID=2077276 RepID=A0A9W6WS25_9STRA|nr:unnamed protein product [Phytophthora lilii]
MTGYVEPKLKQETASAVPLAIQTRSQTRASPDRPRLSSLSIDKQLDRATSCAELSLAVAPSGRRISPLYSRRRVPAAMYSSYWKPNDGRESNVLTDHEALHRDEATHKAMQSDETELRPLDLETIMSSKAAVKFWYLHRPKTMAYVHKNATKIQSLGRAYAVRKLRAKHGAEYMAELARQDQARRDADMLKELSPEERAAKELDDAAYDARVEESRRLRREQIEKERRAEEELRMKQAEAASERRRLEEERKAAELAAKEEAVRLAEEERVRKEQEAEEERRRQEEEAARLEELRLIEEEERRAAEEAEAKRKAEEERLAAEEAARLAEEEAIRAEEERLRREEEERLAAEEAARLAEEERLAEEKRLREEEEERLRIEQEERLAEEERIRKEEEEAAFLSAQAREEEERIAREEEEARIREEEERRAQEEREERERKLAEAALAAKLAEEEAERIRQERIQQEKNEKYEQSLSKDVPVLVRQRGPGRVVSYDKERETYAVKLDNAMGGMQITVPSDDVNLDDDRILSPRTKVDTPFGTGEVVGLDPHVGCYAINTEVNAPDDDQFLAFVQINDVAVHVEEEEERAIVEDASLPSTFGVFIEDGETGCSSCDAIVFFYSPRRDRSRVGSHRRQPHCEPHGQEVHSVQAGDPHDQLRHGVLLEALQHLPVSLAIFSFLVATSGMLMLFVAFTQFPVRPPHEGERHEAPRYPGATAPPRRGQLLAEDDW